MKKIIISAALVAMLSGCATQTIPLTSSVGSAYRGKSITYAIHEKPSFSAMTADKAMFGAIGGLAMISKGNEIIRDNKVPDPAVTIGATLVNDVAAKYGLVVKQPTKQTSSTKTSQVASDNRDADLVLDVQTRNWGFGYFPMNWDHYHVLYGATLKLIDTSKADVLASGSFSYDSKNYDSHRPSYGELVNNQAAGLKQELKTAQTNSIIHFRKQIFDIQE